MVLRKYISTIALVAVLCFTGCDFAKNQLAADRDGGMEVQDYKDALAPRLPDIDEEKDSKSGSASIPALQPYVASGDAASTSSMPLVSISVNQSVPLRDVLFELAQQADYDIELDPRISGSIIFTARERPFDQVIERISDIAGLRYKFDGNTLRVELDTPYNKTYKIDYLSLIRSNSSNISNDISVVSGGGADSGSSYQSSFESESNFWAELETNLQQILATINEGNMRTSADPQITAVEQVATNVVSVAPQGAGGGAVQVSPPNAVLRVESLPTGAAGAAPAAAAGTYAINRQAGLIQIFATEKIQKQIEEYLKLVRRSVTAQVLIEAKILEVSLSDQYATGIDWRSLDLMSGELGLSYLTDSGNTTLNAIDSAADLGAGTLTGLDGLPLGTSGLTVGYIGNDFQSIVRAVSDFGTVKALASPRLTVLNNQSAVLNVATNRVFFEIDIESSSTDGGGTEVDIDSELRNVPEGILVNVQPSIDLDKGVVSMALRPTITRVTGTVDDPGVAFAAARVTPPVEITSSIPELNVQEIDSIIQVKSGQAIVMGGLLQDRSTNEEDGIPGLMEVPLVGNLFKQKVDSIQKTELVILLKATILEQPSESVHDTDRDLYRKFSGDRRPFKL